MHLSDKVLCLGHRTDVEHLLNAADLTVLPSHFETFGLVLAEGMAMGKPAIAFSVGRHAGNRERWGNRISRGKRQ